MKNNEIEQKKEYVAPAIKIVELKRQANLLQGSGDPPIWGGEGA